MKRAYLARLELEMAVIAESEDEAKQIARYNLRDECMNVSEFDFHVAQLREIPDGWDEKSLVYQEGRGDTTIAEAMKLNEEGKLKR